MAQEGCLKIIKNLKNMREDKRKSFFSYWSCCCWTAYITYLRKKYERTNRMRKMLQDALVEAKSKNLGALNPSIIKCLQQQIDLYDAKPEALAEEE